MKKCRTILPGFDDLHSNYTVPRQGPKKKTIVLNVWISDEKRIEVTSRQKTSANVQNTYNPLLGFQIEKM